VSITIIELILSLVLLIFAADRFVVGAASIARNLRINPLIIGLTIVSIGTSSPEIIVAIVAAIHQQPDLIIGSAIGSSIINIGLGIGLIALIKPLHVQAKMLKQEYPVLLLSTIGLGFFMLDGVLSRLNGIILLASFVFVMLWLIAKSKRYGTTQVAEQTFDVIATSKSRISTRRACLWLLIGGVLLPVSARLLVIAAVKISVLLGISQLIIGLTVIAIGTSLPEIAASLLSTLRDEHELSIGNILGSNIFNILLVLGLPSVIHPIPIEKIVLYRDYTAMFVLTIGLFMVSYTRKKIGTIGRLKGGALFVLYLAYLSLLYFQFL